MNTPEEAAAIGLHVIPIEHNGKRPLLKDWPNLATTDAAQIAKWREEFPGCNWGHVPALACLLVLDLDRKNGKDGVAELARLAADHSFEVQDTLVVETPSGGFHLYLKGCVPSSNGKLAPGIDLKSEGGYVLLPGSTLDGAAYRVKSPMELWELPEAPPQILTLANAKTHDRQGAPEDVEHDTSESVSRATVFLESRAPAIEGKGGNEWTYQTAAALRDLGISEERAPELLDESGWNARCVPPWPLDELATVVANAFRYGQNEPGAYAVPPAKELFAAVAQTLAPDVEQPRIDRRVIVLRDEATQDARKPTQMQIEGFMPDGGTLAIQAPFGSFKSFVANDAGFGIAANVPAFGKLKVNRPAPVVFMLEEGLAGFETQRRKAWRSARGIPSDVRLPVYTIDGVPRVLDNEEVKNYFRAIETLKQRPGAIFIDTLSRSMVGLNENDAGDAARYLEMGEELARHFNCLVVTVAHMGKDETRGLRGSSAFEAGFDNVWRVEADKASLTAKLIPVKTKDGADPDTIHLSGRAVAVPGTKGALVFDLVERDDFRRAAGKLAGLQRSDLGQALQRLGAVSGKTVPTRVLATELAGPNADLNMVAAAEKSLRRGSKDRFRGYVAHAGEGRGDATLWWFPAPQSEGNADA